MAKVDPITTYNNESSCRRNTSSMSILVNQGRGNDSRVSNNPEKMKTAMFFQYGLRRKIYASTFLNFSLSQMATSPPFILTIVLQVSRD
jgi:hypothetical protein